MRAQNINCSIYICRSTDVFNTISIINNVCMGCISGACVLMSLIALTSTVCRKFDVYQSIETFDTPSDTNALCVACACTLRFLIASTIHQRLRYTHLHIYRSSIVSIRYSTRRVVFSSRMCSLCCMCIYGQASDCECDVSETRYISTDIDLLICSIRYPLTTRLLRLWLYRIYVRVFADARLRVRHIGSAIYNNISKCSIRYISNTNEVSDQHNAIRLCPILVCLVCAAVPRILFAGTGMVYIGNAPYIDHSIRSV